MQKIETNADRLEVIDVNPVTRRQARRRMMLLGLVIAPLLALAMWWGYENLFLPNSYRKSVESGLEIMKSRKGVGAKVFDSHLSYLRELNEIPHLNEGHRAVVVAETILNYFDDIPLEMKNEIAKDAFDLAIFLNDPHVYYVLGKSISDGSLGLKDKDRSEYYFRLGAEKLKQRVINGEPIATYVYARLMGEGLGGIEEDKPAAVKLIWRVYRELPVLDLMEIMFRAVYSENEFEAPNYQLAFEIFNILPDYAKLENWYMIEVACAGEAGVKSWREVLLEAYEENKPNIIKRLYRGELDGAKRSAFECGLKYLTGLEKIADKGLLEYLTDAKKQVYGLTAKHSNPNLIDDISLKSNSRKQEKPLKFLSPSPDGVIEAINDPEQQSQTGYLNGAPRLALDGLSTFKVDNSQGSGDAIARIYLNGNKPAVRSMYVKHGESFTAKSLPPGSYIFRYRFVGKKDTYEADKTFELKEESTGSGTRYSNVTVTLYKVSDGNMHTRVVDPDKF